MANFVHFNGSEQLWKSRLDSKRYANDVVFAKIWNTDVTPNTCRYVVYGGSDKYDQQYMFEIPNVTKFVNIQNDLNDVKQLVNIDSSSFTNSAFKEALENYLSDSSPIIVSITDQLAAINNTLQNGVVNDITSNSNNAYLSITKNMKASGSVNLSIDASIMAAIDDDEFVSNGLVTDGYIDEKFAWRVISD